MWIFTEIADWFDGKNKQTDQILDKWVEDSGYNQGVMIVAATTHAFTTFGAGFVDLLRLGDGVKEGGWKGYGTDALRFVAIFPVGKAANLIKTIRGTQAAKVLADIDPFRGICSWVASTKALRQVGVVQASGKYYASVVDLVKAAGETVGSIGGIYLSDMLIVLKRIGAKVGPLTPIKNHGQLERMIPRDGSVVLASVDLIKNGKPTGDTHALYFYKDLLGRIRIMDRTSGYKNGRAILGAYKKLSEIARMYGADNLVVYEAAVLHNVYVKGVMFEVPKLVIPILGVIGSYKD